jgi:hypothetical protein
MSAAILLLAFYLISADVAGPDLAHAVSLQNVRFRLGAVLVAIRRRSP